MSASTNPIPLLEFLRDFVANLLNDTSVIAAADAVLGAGTGGDVFPGNINPLAYGHSN